jgi:hypothetical protein
MLEKAGSNSIVHHSSNSDDVDSDVTPRQDDYRAGERSEVSEGPGSTSETEDEPYRTPTALKTWELT